MTKRNQGTFRIAKNMQLIVINHKLTMTLMQLIAIKYFNCLTALIYESPHIKGTVENTLMLMLNINNCIEISQSLGLSYFKSGPFV